MNNITDRLNVYKQAVALRDWDRAAAALRDLVYHADAHPMLIEWLAPKLKECETRAKAGWLARFIHGF